MQQLETFVSGVLVVVANAKVQWVCGMKVPLLTFACY